MLGWIYWLWLLVKVGSFGMFAFGAFFSRDCRSHLRAMGVAT
jgi:hypothetical protein